ncbi:MAG: hypothetical protein KDD40_09155, partial [Bdellovibrionales bacterium]|nr:hypothetical protein [Bdellovibrionales bacterium]
MYKPPKKSEVFLVSIMILFSLGIIYGIYFFNPYFMNRKPLSESLSENQNKSLTIPEAEMEPDSLGPWLFLEQKNIARTYTFDSEFQMSTTYVRESTKKLPLENDAHPPIWDSDEDGFYYTYPDQLIKTNFSNEKKWFFQTQKEDTILNSPIIGSKYLFISTKNGFVYKLHKENGKL